MNNNATFDETRNFLTAIAAEFIAHLNDDQMKNNAIEIANYTWSQLRARYPEIPVSDDKQTLYTTCFLQVWIGRRKKIAEAEAENAKKQSEVKGPLAMLGQDSCVIMASTPVRTSGESDDVASNKYI
jgi:hypothetical protein